MYAYKSRLTSATAEESLHGSLRIENEDVVGV